MSAQWQWHQVHRADHFAYNVPVLQARFFFGITIMLTYPIECFVAREVRAGPCLSAHREVAGPATAPGVTLSNVQVCRDGRRHPRQFALYGVSLGVSAAH